MTNFTVIDTNDDANLKTIRLTDANLWMEPSTKREDANFWVERFKSQRVPFILAQYDCEMLNSKNEKMYRRVYGVFIDMKNWERKNAERQTN